MTETCDEAYQSMLCNKVHPLISVKAFSERLYLDNSIGAHYAHIKSSDGYCCVGISDFYKAKAWYDLWQMEKLFNGLPQNVVAFNLTAVVNAAHLDRLHS